MTSAIYDLLNVPVSATDREVRALIQQRWMQKYPGTAQSRELFKRRILRCHHAAQRIYKTVQRGI